MSTTETTARTAPAGASGTAFHTEHVGSLLRPHDLLTAREQRAAGAITAARLEEAESTAILDAIAWQRDLGLDVITDGEFRRGWFGESLYRAVGGLEPADPRPTGRVWVGPGNEVSSTAEEVQRKILGSRTGWRAVEKVRAEGRISGAEAAFLREHAGGARHKITTMAPAAYTESWFDPGASEQYPRGVDLLADIALVIRDELVALAQEGTPYLQLDSLSYILRFGDEEETRRFLAILGVGRDEAIDAILAADNLILDAARAAGAITSVHMCRGNNRSAWNAKAGTYDVAERALAELHVDRLLLEYDTDRAGSFEPLGAVPQDTTVVLGLVSSKFGELEARDDLLRRIEEASRFHPLERLAVSPQCGFASTAPGNLLSHDDQRRKLELVVSVAREVWG